MAMPTPMTHQAPKSAIGPVARPRYTRPAASTAFEAISNPRPLPASMIRPHAGPPKAITMSESENAPNTVARERPSSAAIGVARIAGRYVEDAQAMVWVVPSAKTWLVVRDSVRLFCRNREHQLVGSLDETGWVVELPALGEERLVEEQARPLVESGVTGLEAPDDRVLRIDLEDRRRRRHFLAGRLKDAREVRAHVVLVGHQARGRLGESRGDPHVLDLVAERALEREQ